MLHSGFQSADIFPENTKRFSNAGTGYASTDRKRADGQIIHEVADSVGYVHRASGPDILATGLLALLLPRRTRSTAKGGAREGARSRCQYVPPGSLLHALKQSRFVR